MAEINKCPHCGYEKAKITEKRSGNLRRTGDMFQVICGRCKARGPVVTAKYDQKVSHNGQHRYTPANSVTREEAKERAIELWNTRHVDGETSDGYHTFNELYHHRAVLFSVIVAHHPELSWKSKHHHDGTMYDGMFIVGINTPHGQATYHYDLPYWDMFKCQEVEHAPEWDGHTAAQAIERIGRLEPVQIGCWGVAEEEHYRALECLEKMQFFMGQRAGRELWMSKPKNVQDVDIEQYNHDIETVMHYIQQLENHISELTEKVAQFEAAQPKWISVEDMLPEDNLNVLVYAIGNNENSVIAMTGYTHKMYGYNIEGWRSPWQYFFYEYKITHWMPLPEAPKEDVKK